MPLNAMAVHTREMVLPPGATLLLCSDGLWNYADAPRRMGLAYTDASKDADAITTCRRLVAFANAAGGRDNVTVAVMVNR
jgi:serine/threonine protein phosphatase PrpC